MDELELVKLRSFREFQVLWNARGGAITKRLSFEEHMARANRNSEEWKLYGYCEPCRRPAVFRMDWDYSDGTVPNYRERMVCEYCGLNNRQRFMANFVKDVLERGNSTISKNIYLYEQVTNFFCYIKENIAGSVVGSEYLGYDKKPGEMIQTIRHEDALDLTLADRSMDVMVSNDVYEHVPDIRRALEEAFRVLRDQGKLVLSIPFHASEINSRKRASMVEGTIQTSCEEKYHGNPMSETGSFVFYDFGWDILDMLRKSGFRDAYAIGYYSYFFGYLGYGLQFMFVAEK